LSATLPTFIFAEEGEIPSAGEEMNAESPSGDSGVSPELEVPAPPELSEEVPQESLESENTENIELLPQKAAPQNLVAIPISENIFINEVELEAEFIEIWNANSEPLDIHSFQFSELSGTSELRHNFSEFTTATTIPANGFLVLNMSRKLNNGGENIKLYLDSAATASIRELVVPATQSGKSYARQSDGSFVWGTPTPGMQNFTDVPLPPPDSEDPPVLPQNSEYAALILNEIDPGAEFLELWNSGEISFDLSNFEFSERSGSNELRHKFSSFSANLTLAPHSFFIISFAQLLNNSGETVKIYIHPQSNDPLSTVEVPALQAGKSYSRKIDGTFLWNAPTPGAENIFPMDAPPPDIPPVTNADYAGLLLNEVDPEAEFLELQNTATAALDLQNFEFGENSGDHEARHKFSDFASDLTLDPQEFLVLSFSRILNNSGEEIRIYSTSTNSDPLLTLTVPEIETGKSYARRDDGTFAWTTPTPGLANIFAAPPPPETPAELPKKSDYAALILNEVDPTAEFIEFFNTGDVVLNLSNFEFSEISGTTEVHHAFADFTTEFLLLPHEFLVLNMSSKLNNSGDTVRIYIHPQVLEPLAVLEIPSAKEGQSFARDADQNFAWTQMPTPGAENIIIAPTATGKTPKPVGADFFPAALQENGFTAEEVVLKITEVAFKDSAHDRIELYCAECGTAEAPQDLSGFRLFDDDVFFEFPLNTFVKTGDYIVLQLKSESEQAQQTSFGWEFQTLHKGLTATDETLILIDGLGTLEDAVCWSNWNGEFSSGEADDFAQMLSAGQWASEKVRDLQCFPSESIHGKMSLARQNGVDSNTAADFFPTAENTFGGANPEPPTPAEGRSIMIEKLVFLPKNKILLTIQNSSTAELFLKGFKLMNAKKTLLDLPDTLLPAGATSSFVVKKPKGNILLTLQDAWEATSDFWCISAAQELIQNDGDVEFLAEMHRRGFWSGRELGSCLAPESFENEKIVRRTFSERSAATDFSAELLLPHALSESPNLFLSRIFPNPKGADEGQEWFEIGTNENISDLNAWLFFVGDDVFSLAESSLVAGDTLRISSGSETFDSLGNKRGEISFLNSQSELYGASWEKAKDNAILEFRDGELLWDIPEKAKKEKKGTEETSEFQIFGDEISAEIVSVLPNPEGKDAGNEVVVLKNISGHTGTLRFWQFDTGKKPLRIADTFFEVDQEVAFFGKGIVPNLKNTAGVLQILDPFGTSKDEVSWQKARDGELFGKNIHWEKPAKKAKAKKARTVKKSKSAAEKNGETEISGRIQSFSAKGISLVLTDGAVKFYPFAAKTPQDDFFLRKFLQMGTEITLTISEKGEIIGFDATPISPFVLPDEKALSINFFFLSSIFLISACVTGYGAYRKKRLLTIRAK